MAIDNIDKRFSMLNFSSMDDYLPNADGAGGPTAAKVERVHRTTLYTGVLLAAPPAPGGGRLMSSIADGGGLISMGGIAGRGGGLVG